MTSAARRRESFGNGTVHCEAKDCLDHGAVVDPRCKRFAMGGVGVMKPFWCIGREPGTEHEPTWVRFAVDFASNPAEASGAAAGSLESTGTTRAPSATGTNTTSTTPGAAGTDTTSTTPSCTAGTTPSCTAGTTRTTGSHTARTLEATATCGLARDVCRLTSCEVEGRHLTNA
jgi:hypothetical protein